VQTKDNNIQGYQKLWTSSSLCKIPRRIPKTERITKVLVFGKNQKESRETQKYFRAQQLNVDLLVPLLLKLARAYEDHQPVLVFDPFCGSGSTAVAARKTSVLFVGMDKDPYCIKAGQVILTRTQSDKTGKYRESSGLFVPDDLKKKLKKKKQQKGEEDEGDEDDEGDSSDEDEEEEIDIVNPPSTPQSSNKKKRKQPDPKQTKRSPSPSSSRTNTRQVPNKINTL